MVMNRFIASRSFFFHCPSYIFNTLSPDFTPTTSPAPTSACRLTESLYGHDVELVPISGGVIEQHMALFYRQVAARRTMVSDVRWLEMALRDNYAPVCLRYYGASRLFHYAIATVRYHIRHVLRPRYATPPRREVDSLFCRP